MGREEISNEENKNMDEAQEENHTLNEEKQNSKHAYIRNKMEEMQKRIDELKEKVKYEGEFLHNEEASLKSDVLELKFDDSFCDLQDSFEQTVQENESTSEKSLYFSASSYSLCSLSSSSTDSAYYNFTKFVSNFVKNQNQKERLSLLQLHSNKQISMNMMRHSLTELDSRCSVELELVEKSLQHLNRLAAEFNVDAQSHAQEDFKQKALEFYNWDDAETMKRKVRNNQTFIWPPLKDNTEVRIDWNNNPAFVKPESGNSTVL